LGLIETLIRRGFLQAGPSLTAAYNTVSTGNIYEPQDIATPEDAHDVAHKISRAVGLWELNDDGQKILLEGIADILLKNISPEDPRRNAAVERFQGASGKEFTDVATREPLDSIDLYDRLRIHAAEILLQGVTGSWFSKTSKIVGKAMSMFFYMIVFVF
jgi:hypothetical protein